MPGAMRYIPTREVDARHQAAKMASPRGEARTPQQLNTSTVLSLGSTRYLRFRNGVYAVPMVGFKVGQRILELYIIVISRAKEVAKDGNKKSSDAYYVALRQLSKLLWANMRHGNRVLRMFRRVGLTRNPLANASDQELRDLTNFFLQGRMKSTVQSLSTVESLDLN